MNTRTHARKCGVGHGHKSKVSPSKVVRLVAFGPMSEQSRAVMSGISASGKDTVVAKHDTAPESILPLELKVEPLCAVD